jgi:hypothetical protein
MAAWRALPWAIGRAIKRRRSCLKSCLCSLKTGNYHVIPAFKLQARFSGVIFAVFVFQTLLNEAVSSHNEKWLYRPVSQPIFVSARP